MPLYAKNHSQGEYVFDHAWANAYEQAGGRYYPKLQSSIPFSPVNSSKLLTMPGTNKPDIQQALLSAAKKIAHDLNISSLHITFLPEDERTSAQTANYLLRTDQQFHWNNSGYTDFEDFLSALSSRKRKQIRKERKTASSNNIQIEAVTGADTTANHWDAFYNFYLDTSARKWGQPYLNRAFFTEIAETMPEKILLVMCKKEDSYIAGALNFIGRDTLYGRYWGCIEDHPCLHFEACYYQAIEYAIENKISLIEAGAQGTHKLARGYEPTPTYSAHWLTQPGFRSAVENFLISEKQNIDAEIEYLSGHTPFKTQ